MRPLNICAPRWSGISALAVCLATMPAAAEDVNVKDRGELAATLSAAKPGTVILVAPGTYAGGLSASGVSGEKGKPIVIRAADLKKPPVIEGGQSGIHLSGCSFIELENLTLTGAKANGLNIDDGGARDR